MSELLGQTSPANNGIIGFFYDDHEILPHNVHGRFYFDADGQQVTDLEVASKARALVEGQLLAKRLYLQRANVDLNNNVDQIVVTGEFVFLERQIIRSNLSFDVGGASVNTDLLQILADIFAKPVYTASAPNSGALGGALRAVDVINQKPNTVSSTVECVVAAKPRGEYTSLYDDMLNRYAKLEDKIVQDNQQ